MAVCAQGAQYIFPPRVHPGMYIFCIKSAQVCCTFAVARHLKNCFAPFSDHPDECHYKGPPELFIKLTETVQMPEGCGRLICTEKQFIFAHTYVYLIRTWLILRIIFCRNRCGVVAVPNGCRNVPDLSKPYPECCIDIVCDQNEITAEDEDY